METKRCPICGETKSLDEYHSYYSKARGKTRIGNYCKACAKVSSLIRAKQHYQDNKEAKKEYARAYRIKEENLEKVKSWQSRAKIRHRENLQDCYVRDLLTQKKRMSLADIESMPEIVETKRLQIKIKRKIKSLRNGKK